MMAPSFNIRRADERDAGGLGKCLDAAYATYAERIPDLPTMSENCAAEIADNLVWVADGDNEIVGVLVLSPRDGFMLLVNVAVHPDTRGTGLGKRLLSLAEAEATDRGFTEMRLKTHADMPETVGLYERNGWARTDQRGKTVSMRKSLATQ
jgi:ribosomal protein S18 acetylase RimI-like enzyme